MICWAVVLVWLICGFPTGCEGAPAALKSNSNEETCENQLHPGSGLSCCGGNAFNPETAEDGYNQIEAYDYDKETECCCPDTLEICRCIMSAALYQSLHGPNPNNTPSEPIDCSQSTALAFPAPNAVCCGNETFNKDTQLCCNNSRIILERNSPDHECCGQKQYDKKTECCCPDTLKIQPKHSNCCMESGLHGPNPNNTPSEPIDCSQSTALAFPAPNAVCCGNETFNKDTQLCCNNSRIILERNSPDHECCGQKQYDKKTECCCPDTLKIQPKHSNCCMESGLHGPNPNNTPSEPIDCSQSTALAFPAPNAVCCGNETFNKDTQLCCNNSRIILERNSTDHECCGQKQYDKKTECCCPDTLKIQPKHSNCCMESGLHGPNPNNTPSEPIDCSQSTALAFPAPNAVCCGNETFNKDTQLCCNNSRIILERNSPDHECCGQKQYDKKTECCCPDTLKIQPKHSNCCMESGLHGPNPNNTPSEPIDCSQSTALAFPAPNAVCCGNETFNKDTQLCCNNSRIILERNSTDHECCGQKQYDKKTECCCPDTLKIQPKHSNCCMESGLHGPNPNNTPSEPIDCSQSTALAFPAPNAVCCGNETFNKDTQLCCSNSRIILERNSTDHECCGQEQYDKKTECCCPDTLEIQPKHSNCCMESGAPQQSPVPQLNCIEPKSSICGSSCYDPNHFRCCERNQENSLWCCAPGRCEDAPSVYNPHTHICCDGCVSEWKSWLNQCCGERAYGFAQPGVLCCNNTLFEDREDGEECSALGVPFNPAKGTMCSSKFHGSPGRHCCGTEKYHPKTEICCDGHRHQNRTENTHCCGGKAYNIQDPLMKCCRGTLYNLTAGHEGQCCGSVLQTSQDVCCSSEDKEVLYMAKTAFQCCGHHYYNSSLWSCCAGKLSPVRPASTMSKESRLLSVNNVKGVDLCNKLHTGIVESVSSHSVVFSSVLIIHGRNATVTHLASPYILKKHNHCTFPKLTPWRSYFFDDVNVFADFNHDSTLQSLHFILSRCYRL